LRVFLDTSVLASAFATRGLCAELFERIADEHDLVTGEPVLVELERVSAGTFRLSERTVGGILDLIRTEGQVIRPADAPRLSFKDKDDIPILACVVAARPDAFVTGDKALLDLGSVEGIPVLSPRELWLKLAGLEGRGGRK
jgi:putative PIN family toxin of toxin-antitoxin system